MTIDVTRNKGASWSRPWSSARERLAGALGVTPAGREAVLRAMLEKHGKERASYWLELILSMGIATYGLVLGSTGVVIGAMLVSPLMSPLVEIGMGLVTGSAVLTIHATLRTVSSIAVVIGASALLTYLLPYHELTAEIAARTAPTLIDLYVASFCALAAAYTTARQSSDTVAAAAGTAISISLVPPLCVVGWGLGSRTPHAAAGAALLFTANLCAILLFTVVVFLVLGFDASGAVFTGGTSTSDRLAARLHAFFGTKYGPALRLLMPVALTAVVFVPLRRALDEVAWKTRVQSKVERMLEALPSSSREVRSSVVVANGAVSVRLVVVGSPRDAASLESVLKKRILEATGVAPAVDVLAVPDDASIRAIAEGAIAPRAEKPSKPVLDPTRSRSAVDAALHDAWPSSAGALRAWRLVVGGDGSETIVVVHFGAPLGAAGEELLAAALKSELEGSYSLRDVALTSEASNAAAEDGRAWLPSLARDVDRVVDAQLGVLCVSFPADTPRPRESDVASIEGDARAELSRLPQDRYTLATGDRWSVRIAPAQCTPAKTDPDAGAPIAPAATIRAHER